MLVIQRIVSECASSARHFHCGILVERSSSVVRRGWHIASCHSMASSVIEPDSEECKDGVRTSLEHEDDHLSAKRRKTSHSSLENEVGILTGCIFYNLVRNLEGRSI